MDIERLTKSQIVLLTLMVSFVTSIATGIVTVTLMEQAPPTVTQTVNRIVERTVETVVPERNEGEVAGAATTIIEREVVVRESDLLAKVVAAAEPSIVRFFVPGRDESGRDIQLFAGFGIVVSETGEIVADSGTPEGVHIVRADGVSVSVERVTRLPGEKFLYLQADLGAVGDSGEPLSWKPVVFATRKPALGQAVVAMGGRDVTRLGGGIVTSVTEGGESQIIETDIALESFAAGSPLVTADGIVGVATRETRTSGANFLASSAIVLDNEGDE